MLNRKSWLLTLRDGFSGSVISVSRRRRNRCNRFKNMLRARRKPANCAARYRQVPPVTFYKAVYTARLRENPKLEGGSGNAWPSRGECVKWSSSDNLSLSPLSNGEPRGRVPSR
jgi:hypothetical protein